MQDAIALQALCVPSSQKASPIHGYGRAAPYDLMFGKYSRASAARTRAANRQINGAARGHYPLGSHRAAMFQASSAPIRGKAWPCRGALDIDGWVTLLLQRRGGTRDSLERFHPGEGEAQPSRAVMPRKSSDIEAPERRQHRWRHLSQPARKALQVQARDRAWAERSRPSRHWRKPRRQDRAGAAIAAMRGTQSRSAR